MFKTEFEFEFKFKLDLNRKEKIKEKEKRRPHTLMGWPWRKAHCSLPGPSAKHARLEAIEKKENWASLSPNQAQPASPLRFWPKSSWPSLPAIFEEQMTGRFRLNLPSDARHRRVPTSLASARVLRRLDGDHPWLPGTSRGPFPLNVNSGPSLTRLDFD